MPKDETFWNPYRLIPVQDTISKKRPLTDEKFRANSGRIYCTIENLTPLFIGGNRNNSQQFLISNGKHIIPGSSLKGMLRSLAEIIGGGCSVTDSNGQFNRTYTACNKVDSLCVTCRMFGMMERGRGARVHKGKIFISDALTREEKPETKLFDVQLFSHGTRHEPFYSTPQTGRLDGKSRKFYFHQPKRKNSALEPTNIQKFVDKKNAILPGCQFEFEIDFVSLEKFELELLVYILALEENVDVIIEDGKIPLKGPMRHKLGYAKPLGLGSCRIDLNKIEYFAAPAERFSSLGQTENIVYERDALKTLIKTLTHRFVSDTSTTMQQLRKMMVWDENDPRDFAYPKNHWFNNASNSEKALKHI